MSNLVKLQKYLSLKYYQYEVTTAIYILEPWEKCCINTLVATGLCLSLYTSFIYIPEYTKSFFRLVFP
ncbi:hypothetical protein DSO57_1000866 [Entomophthora muscae]|uniref:Uncharacterized protein n=2 Tax=Entomophthora muscae TaxID=34485 RepID=A0ACC2SY03_9FUNG|nr:hypothetical protein DSO57_1010633 [Entomophthora muscae]KAJ9067283.1 hypothetical protein DSO57_1000866 [Entomophthora muscae]